ncbi:MAG TPA: FAD-binding protein [Polyangiaceae bacterium]|jgi:FAD/FMN-containing dehydrogenase|nr:FAD-binding protein [Polyangiaceae bacterium]
MDRSLFGSKTVNRSLLEGKRLNHAPRLDPATGKWTFRNWGGNHSFTPDDTFSPQSLDELLQTVERYGIAGRKIKAVGGLHSWSACAVAEDVCVRMHRLDRLLGHDDVAKTVTFEAGIALHALYEELDRLGLAIASIPNVDTIQLGGAIANATHGTNFSRGTMSSYVQQLQVVVFQSESGDPSQGKAELVTLRRDDPDPTRRAWFEAAVASFGSLGVIYAVTLQCEEAYACFVIEHSFPFSHIDGRIAEIAQKHYSAFISIGTPGGMCRSRIQAPIPSELVEVDSTCLLTEGDLRVLKVLLWAASPTPTSWPRLRGVLNRFFYKAATGRVGSRALKQHRPRQGVMSWRDAELLSRVFAVTATAPWTNLEYAVPVHRADEAARMLLGLTRAYPAVSSFCMRPVGADTAGFLSPTKDRPTVFFDIAYHRALLHTGVYDEIEKVLLGCEGRCSWSRLFRAPASQVVAQYPQYPDFVRAKREMDPCNVFSNAFSDSILFGKTGPLRL